MFFSNINYITIGIATIAGMAIGAIWYSPFAFRSLWMKSKGCTTEEQLKALAGKPGVGSFAAMFVSTFFTAVVVAALFNSLIITSFAGMVLLGALMWLGFSVPTKLGDYLFGGDSLTYLILSLGQQLVVNVAIALIIGIWS